MGLNIKGKWTLGGSLPGEPVAPVELGIGAPLTGLYLREDVDMKCNIVMTGFVKKTLKNAHSRLVDRLVVKAQFEDNVIRNERLSQSSRIDTRSHFSGSQATTNYSPSEYGDTFLEEGNVHRPSSRFSTQSGAPQLPVISTPEFWGHASPDFRGRMSEPMGQTTRLSTLTVQGPTHVRSFSEQRPQYLPYPDMDATNAQGHRASFSGSFVEPERPRLPYPESNAGTPQVERKPWQNQPSNHSASIEDLDVAFQEAAPAYHDYAQSSVSVSVELPSNEHQYGGGRTRNTAYEGVSRVYGAAELA